MKRDFRKIAQEVCVNAKYDMDCTEAQELFEMFRKDPYTAISTCFNYGYAMGQRSTKTK